MKKKSEKSRLDFDKDFIVGFAVGIMSNLVGSYLYEKIKTANQKKLNA
jgi:hypothetical protein